MAEVAGEGEDSEEDEEHSDDDDEGDEEEEEGQVEEGQEEVEQEPIETSTTSKVEIIPQPPLELESLSLSNLDLSEIHGDSNSDSEDDNDNNNDNDNDSDESFDDRESLADSISHRRHRPSTRVPPPSAAEVGTIVTERLARLKRNTERKHGGRAQSANVLGKQKGSKMKNDTRRAIKDNAQF